MTISFINIRGQEAIITSKAPFLLGSFDGYGEIAADIQTQSAPHQDGSMYIDSLLEERPLNITFNILADDSLDLSAKRRFISSVFNPKNGLGILRHEKNGIIYEIDAIAESVPQYPSGTDNRGLTHQRVVVNLIAPNPYWRSLHQESKPLHSYVGNFKLPMTFPFMLGTSGSKTTLYNDGDATAPIEIEIHGPTTNPQIFNRTTGESLRINRTISEGEILYIDTTPGQKRVEILSGGVYVQAFGFLDHDSTLFQLDFGENEIEHVADAGNRHAQVIVRWQSRYVGI